MTVEQKVGAREGAGISSRIPGEFRYWEHIEKPSSQRMRRILRLVFQMDPVLSDAQVRSYAASYYDADPVAEAFVEEVYMQHGQAYGRRLLDRALAEGIDAVPEAPASMKALFAEIERPPDWLEPEQVALGARVFRRYGTHMYSFAGAITLHGYLENSVARPLALTGAYTGESANRRFLETAGFWIDVSSPDGLLPGGVGIKIALRVRVMHVFVRKRLLQHPEWDLDAWGVPISQGDALLTLMGGSFVPGFGLKLLGYRTSHEEIEAMMHFWRYVGHLLGVQPRWYPQDLREALGLMFTSHVKGIRASGDDGRHLAQSYVASYAPQPSDGWLAQLEKWWEYKLQLGYVRLFVPPSTHAKYELPGAGVWRLHPMVQAPLIFGLETLRKRSQTIDDWVDARAQRSTQHWLRKRLGQRSPEYQAVSNFTR